jgi:hypothetical protein
VSWQFGSALPNWLIRRIGGTLALAPRAAPLTVPVSLWCQPPKRQTCRIGSRNPEEQER